MKKLAVWIAALGVGALGANVANAQSMSLTSSEIKEGGTIANEQVFKGFGCAGGNVSPGLSWSGAPSGTKSLAVSIYDPDAPTGSGWWHWVVFNIPPNVTSLPKGAGDLKTKLMPKGAIQSRTDFGADGYGGPCPPAGFDLHFHTLAKATLTGLYGR
jgi:Raf kinase inhibitor-like YbhB/YbcL family protein